MESGLLVPAENISKNVPTPATAKKSCDIEWVRKQAEEAEQIIAQAKRKAKMALLLTQGGFEEEVQTPLDEACSLLFGAYDKTIAMSKEMNDMMLLNLLSQEKKVCKDDRSISAYMLLDKIDALKGHLQDIVFSANRDH